MRLFAAVHPPGDALDHLEGALNTLRGRPAGRPGDVVAGVRWTPPQDRHVTVAFFGEVPAGYVDELTASLDALVAEQLEFEASLAGAGLFDRRTLWVGCTGSGWTSLMGAAREAGATLGRTLEERSRPHLTVARARPRFGGDRRRRNDGRDDRSPGRRRDDARRTPPGAGAPDPADLVHALALYRGPAWTVREVQLVSSRLGAGPGGSPRHEVVHTSPLAPVAG